MTLRDISVEKKRRIRELHRLNPWSNLKILVFLGIWAGCGLVAVSVPVLPVRLACYFVIGATLQGLAILMHEGVHRIMFRDRTLNRGVAFLCGLPVLLSVTAYRLGHLPHHRYERGAGDPDEVENLSRDPRVVAGLLLLVLLAGELFGVWRVGPSNAMRGRPEERRDIIVEYVLIVMTFAVAFALVPPGILLHVWFIPALVALQLTNVRTFAEHALTGHGGRFAVTRTVSSNRFVSFFMCNLNYHLVHHLYPGVPWYNLPRLHRLLAPELAQAGAAEYRSYTRLLLDFCSFVRRAWGPGGVRLALTLPARLAP